MRDRPRTLSGRRADRGGDSRAARPSTARDEHRVAGLARSRRVRLSGARPLGLDRRSRDPGLHGRKPAFRSPRAIAQSYIEGYVDYTGRVRGYGVADLDGCAPGLRLAVLAEDMWKVERLLIKWPHRKIKTSDVRYRASHAVTLRSRKPWSQAVAVLQRAGSLAAVAGGVFVRAGGAGRAGRAGKAGGAGGAGGGRKDKKTLQ